MMKKPIYALAALLMACTTAFAQNKQAADSTNSIKSYKLEEVVVTGSRMPVPRELLPVPVSVVNRATIEQSPATNLMPVLSKHVPSLFVTSRGMAGYGVATGAAGGINLRGFSGGAGRVLMLIDGHPQYATIFGHPVADAYIASEAQRVEVSRGAASVLYGSNAMGGTINIITRRAMEPGNKLSARIMAGSHGTQRYELTDSYRNHKLEAVASINHERSTGHRPDMEFESLSGYGKVGYEFSERWRATANVNVTKSNSQNPGSTAAPLIDNKADVLRSMSALSIENKHARSAGAINLYYNYGKHEIDYGYSPGSSPQEYLFHSTDYMGGVNIYQMFDLWDNIVLTGGVDVKLYGGNAYQNPETQHFADHVKLHETAAYVLAQQKLERSMFEVGLRVEHHKLYGTEFVPQAGFSLKPAANTNLKLSVSKGFRTPNMRELYMYATANEELLPETSWSYDLGVQQAWLNHKLTTELTLYYTKGDNIVEVIQVDGRPQNRNVGAFVNKGVELTADYHPTRLLALHANYSYLHMDTPITGAPRHKLYAGATYTPGKLSLSAGAQLINKLYLATTENAPTSSYLIIDARVAYKATRWLNVFVSGENLTARKYETMLGYQMPRATVMAGVGVSL